MTSPVSVIATTVSSISDCSGVGGERRLTSAILEIKNTVLLEDRTKHGLDDDAWAWVGDE